MSQFYSNRNPPDETVLI